MRFLIYTSTKQRALLKLIPQLSTSSTCIKSPCLTYTSSYFTRFKSRDKCNNLRQKDKKWMHQWEINSDGVLRKTNEEPISKGLAIEEIRWSVQIFWMDAYTPNHLLDWMVLSEHDCHDPIHEAILQVQLHAWRNHSLRLQKSKNWKVKSLAHVFRSKGTGIVYNKGKQKKIHWTPRSVYSKETLLLVSRK